MDVFSLKIFSPLEDFFAGDVTSLSSVNSKGPFDILPFHADFVTLINNEASLRGQNGSTVQKMVVILPTGEKKEFTFNQAVVRVREGKAEVFVDFEKIEQLLPEMKIIN
jgi:F0F1-type ATP synthase epsilon subunit